MWLLTKCCSTMCTVYYCPPGCFFFVVPPQTCRNDKFPVQYFVETITRSQFLIAYWNHIETLLVYCKTYNQFRCYYHYFPKFELHAGSRCSKNFSCTLHINLTVYMHVYDFYVYSRRHQWKRAHIRYLLMHASSADSEEQQNLQTIMLLSMCMHTANHKKEVIGVSVGSVGAVVLLTAGVITLIVVVYKYRTRFKWKLTGE